MIIVGDSNPQEDRQLNVYIAIAAVGVVALGLLLYFGRGRVGREEISEDPHQPPEEVIERLSAPVPDPSLEIIPQEVIKNLSPKIQPKAPSGGSTTSGSETQSPGPSGGSSSSGDPQAIKNLDGSSGSSNETPPEVFEYLK